MDDTEGGGVEGAGNPADRLAARILGGPLAIAVLLLCAFQLATWIPHFLTWPYFIDHEVYANLALRWETGGLPYRDSACNNFPGTIYLFWALGKLFGWGRTAPAFAADAALVVLLGGAMLAWSARRFGALLPGAVGYAAFVSYYLGLNYSLVLQHDWHGPLCVMLGIMLLEAASGRCALAASAALMGVAFVSRPQTVLLAPAALLAAAESGGRSGDMRGSGLRAASWALLASAFAALAFAPLLAAGVGGDFVRGVRFVAYGSHYNRLTLPRFAMQLVVQALHPEYLAVPAAIGLLRSAPANRDAPRARVWLLALACAWLYKPVSPVPWAYLSHPLALIAAVNLAVLADLLRRPGLAPASVRLVALLLTLIAAGVKLRPEYCSVQRSRAALADLRRGAEPVEPPLGYVGFVESETQRPYRWTTYREVVAYLRKTAPETKLANVLRTAPALVGPTGRPSALPAESLAWLVVNPSALDAFAEALERAGPETLVVWAPFEEHQDDRYRLAPAVRRLAPVVRRHYEPEARFGVVEVWRRKRDPARGGDSGRRGG